MTFRGNLIQTSFPPFCSSMHGWCTNVGALAVGAPTSPTHKCTCLCQLDRSYHKPTISLKCCSNWCPTALPASSSRYRSKSLVCVSGLRLYPSASLTRPRTFGPLSRQTDAALCCLSTLICLHSSVYIHLSSFIPATNEPIIREAGEWQCRCKTCQWEWQSQGR